MASEQPKEPAKKKNGANDWLRYTTMGWQLVAFIGIFVVAGYGLDAWLGTEKPWFTVVLSVVGGLASMVYLVRRLL